MSRIIYSIESHEQALGIWRKAGLRDAKLLHIDFHCDQRGLLVNRKKERAYGIWTRFPQIDEGNFLKHAVLEGVIGQIRWVHDEPGGRRDDIKSVKYESDLTSLFHRAALTLRGEEGVPLKYEVMRTADWRGIEPGEILDIDWDYFAALEYPADSVQNRVDSFLDRDFGHVPEQTIVCYSPEYSHPTRRQFNEFISELASRFDAEVVVIPRPASRKAPSSLRPILKSAYRPARQFYHSACLALRRRGIF